MTTESVAQFNAENKRKCVQCTEESQNWHNWYAEFLRGSGARPRSYQNKAGNQINVHVTANRHPSRQGQRNDENNVMVSDLQRNRNRPRGDLNRSRRSQNR